MDRWCRANFGLPWKNSCEKLQRHIDLCVMQLEPSCEKYPQEWLIKDSIHVDSRPSKHAILHLLLQYTKDSLKNDFKYFHIYIQRITFDVLHNHIVQNPNTYTIDEIQSIMKQILCAICINELGHCSIKPPKNILSNFSQLPSIHNVPIHDHALKKLNQYIVWLIIYQWMNHKLQLAPRAISKVNSIVQALDIEMYINTSTVNLLHGSVYAEEK